MELTSRLNHYDQSPLQPVHITGSPKASHQIKLRPRRAATQTCSVYTDLTFGVCMCWTSSLSSSSLSSSWRGATQYPLPWLLLAQKDVNDNKYDSAVLLQSRAQQLGRQHQAACRPRKTTHT